jgi:hypothetical protein
MATTRELRAMWSRYRCCATNHSLTTEIDLLGEYAGRVAIPFFQPMAALGQALTATGYQAKSVWIPRNCPTGISGHTCQEDGDWCSLHNYCIAVDIDPFGLGNPHFYKPFGDGWSFFDCKLTLEQVEAVEAIRNTHGEQVHTWLGWAIGDTMHFQGNVPPDRCDIDWTTVPEGGPIDMAGINARDVQKALADADYDIGNFTPAPGLAPDGEPYPPGADDDWGGKSQAALTQAFKDAKAGTGSFDPSKFLTVDKFNVHRHQEGKTGTPTT